MDLAPADTIDVTLEGADAGDGADDTGSRDHAELDVTDAACLHPGVGQPWMATLTHVDTSMR